MAKKPPLLWPLPLCHTFELYNVHVVLHVHVAC